MQKNPVLIALADIAAATLRYPLVGMLGWQDVRQRYRRSALGPFWLTISMGVMIGTIGLVFGEIFKTPLTEFLPFLAAGMIFWNFIASVVTEGCASFIAADGIIKQLPIPLFVHVMRMIWRNILILGHNIVIFPLVLLAVGRPLSWLAVVSIPGFMLVVVNLTWVSLLLGVLCARYRDLPQIVANVLQVFFYLTPIMWMPASLPGHTATYLLKFNPVYYVLSVARAPLLGELPTLSDWMVSLGLAVFGWLVALLVYGRYKRRIAYWL
ncbi:MAG: ABC transporter permease [Rhodanobacter sp.]|jgi:lipopolysaccharide transport system permease protein